ncbi:MAG: competence/damage-inducible protein A, partial [Rivularia sp. (in: cyanobacteria)]
VGLAGENEVESFEFRFNPVRGRMLIRHFSACNALDSLRRKLLQRG